MPRLRGALLESVRGMARDSSEAKERFFAENTDSVVGAAAIAGVYRRRGGDRS